MTTHQLVALSFPLLTALAVAVVALFVRRPWTEKPVEVGSPSRERVLEHVERLNAEIEVKTHLVRQELRHLKNTR
ncbi:exported hypothetical protein [Bradyrhizobium sp. ORS 375]|uniref:hypothetical protein n=1 Tax=Bradyrhizobium sp. (strain ORS 375) TaxID=566679 RepID=UPI0002405E26|nr:hypothetical protein [Bradyrhizobium sp. ORS 375]CCD94316.1 exported hypothetical protein [Bradyrhizobium sp. ORS 375]